MIQYQSLTRVAFNYLNLDFIQKRMTNIQECLIINYMKVAERILQQVQFFN